MTVENGISLIIVGFAKDEFFAGGERGGRTPHDNKRGLSSLQLDTVVRYVEIARSFGAA